jgi:hypothetical protein
MIKDLGKQLMKFHPNRLVKAAVIPEKAYLMSSLYGSCRFLYASHPRTALEIDFVHEK